MLGGIRTDLLVTVAVLFLTHTGPRCRAENELSFVTLPDWRENSEYVTQCFDDRQGTFNCAWTRTQRTSGEVVVNILQSGPLGLEGQACLEFWYLTPADDERSELRALLKSSTALVEIWSALPGNAWRQVFVPLNVWEAGTQVVFEASKAGPLEREVIVNRIGVRRGPCGPQCESNTELWTDASSRCLCSDGQLSCFPAECPQGQICGPGGTGAGGILASGTCTIHSDTDCSTFDGVLFRFMAPCSYVLAKSCSPGKALPDFSVEVVNEQNGNASLSAVQQVIVKVGNHRVSLLRTQMHRVVVNGVWKKLPLRLRNFHIKNNPAAILLRTSFGLSVSFDRAGALHVSLPTKYSEKVCGLCGNFNHRQADDFTMSDGTVTRDVTALAESWQTGTNSSSCETMHVPHQCDPLEMDEFAGELYCGGLLSRTGTFSSCLAAVESESYFRGCMAGMCSSHGDPAGLCETLNVYARMCQEAGVTLPPWRNSTICTLQCGENSHYNSCANGCPDVCSSLDISGSCGSCEERCECDSGFKLDGGKCVPAEDCGCWYKGTHYQKGETLMDGDCQHQCRCMGNNDVQCRATQCEGNDVCKIKDGDKGCFAFTPATCAVYGDPHYTTFDGMAYDFQGGCSYTLTTTCGTESAVQFSVIGHNMHPPQENFTRSKLQAVTLQVDDLKLTLNMSGEVYANNNPVQIPYFTNGSYGSVWCEVWKNFVILESTFGLRMLIDGQHRLFLQVDDSYKYGLCGLCGTFSEHQDDDFVTPGGQTVTEAFEFADSWRTPGDTDCVAHPNDPRVCDYDQENEAYDECYALLGDPFQSCFGTIHPSIYLNSCVNDYCATNGDPYTLCESLKSYAAACEVAGVELPDWQTGTVCADPPSTAAPTSSSPTPDQTLCPINCDFENNLCGWDQLIQDSFDWTRNSGPTPSGLTGPNQDHTTGSGFYMYIEGDSVTHGDSARMRSSMCYLEGPLCLRFWYHMHGSATAMAMNIYLLRGNRATKIWSRVNNQGPMWHQANVEINVSGPFEIIVEGIRGSNHQSDIAIDDISISFGSCSGSVPGEVIGTKPPSATAEMLPPQPVCNFECSFDSHLCSWSQMITDAFDWTWHSGSTPTLMTGPSADHTGDGRYLYIEASSATYGDTARLVSSECYENGPQCLRFWYHMHGSADTMGLNVYLLENRLADAVWWKRNDQGNMWRLAEVDLTTSGAFKVIFEGRRGSNEESDVAIDDVALYRGRCADLSDVVTSPPRPGNTTAAFPTTAAPQPPMVNDTAQPPVATVTASPGDVATTDFIIAENVTDASDNRLPPHPVCQLDCNFEQDFCQWSQLLADVFDWTRHRGATPTMMTGPSSDHTTGDGHYLYIEANSATHGDTARLISSECTHSGPQCLRFWYHMHGSADTMGLHVYLLQDRLAEAVFWKRNNQGNVWHLAQVDITTAGKFQIIFEGRRGSNDESDVAVDDVSFHYGSCADLVKPVTPAPTVFDTSATEIPDHNTTQPQTSQPSTSVGTTMFPTSDGPESPTESQTERQSTVRPQPPTTVLPQPPTTTLPQPPTSDGPESPTESQTDSQSTARPQPPTSAQTYPPTTDETESSTENQTQPQSTGRPQPPSTGQTQLPTTAKPQPPTSDGPEFPTESQTQPESTARPLPPTSAKPEAATSDGPETPTESQTQPQSTARPQPPTSVGPELPTESQTLPESTARPQPPTSIGPELSTESQTQPAPTARPQPPSTGQTQLPTTAKPQPPTSDGPEFPTESQTQPELTARPQPPTSAKPEVATSDGPETPTESQTHSQSTARPQPPTSAQTYPPTTDETESSTENQTQPQSTGRPQPPSTGQTQLPTTAKPQPPTSDGPESPTENQTQPQSTGQTQLPTTAKPQPTTSDGPEFPTESQTQPQSTARPQPPTSAQTHSPTSDGPESPTESLTKPQSTARPQPTTSVGPELPTESQTQPESTARPQPPTSIGPELSTESQTQPEPTARPQPPSTGQTQLPTTAKPQPPTSDGPEFPTESQTQPESTARPQPPTSAKPELATSDGPETPTESQTQPQSTARPQPPTSAQTYPPTSDGTESPTESLTRPQSTARPQPTTSVGPEAATSDGPESPTGSQTQPQPTARPQPPTSAQTYPPTSDGTESPTESLTRPQSTASPQPPTSAQTYPPTSDGTESTTESQTHSQSTGRPQPPTSAKPEPATSVGPESPTESQTQLPSTGQTQLPTTAKPQPPTSDGPESSTGNQTQPQSTARPQPPTTAQSPTTTQPELPTTAQPQLTTAQPVSPTTAQPQPPTTAKPEPPTTTASEHTTSSHPPTTERPKPTTTLHPQPPTTALPQPPTTAVTPTTTSRPSLTTEPSCPRDSHYTTCIPACSPTCSDLNGPQPCSLNQSCVPGCVCNDGFVQKGRVCVPIQQCGCLDRDGTKHQFNEVWYTSHCNHECKCKKDHGVGEIDCEEEDECDGNAVCLQNDMGDYYCQRTGFRECTINGDPEYRTFDKFKYDFEGRHSYVLVRTRNLPNNLQDVYIEGINRRTNDEDDSHHHGDSSEENSRRVRDKDEDEDSEEYEYYEDHDHDHDEDDERYDDSEENSERNRLQEIKIRVYNRTVEFKKRRKLIINGRRVNTPVSMPGIKIWQRSSRIHLKTDFGLSVEFDGHSEAEIILPHIYKKKVGGLCGNFDGRKQNDLTKPDGTRAPNVQEFGESWRV